MSNPINQIDWYKYSHKRQYPDGTEFVYSNFTARSGKWANIPNSTGTVFFGLSYFIQKYLIDDFNENFFNKPKDQVVSQYKRRVETSLGGVADTTGIEELHDLGYLPIRISAVPEGSFVPYGVPSLIIYNTDPRFAWLTNYLETILSCYLWKPCTSATTARWYRKLLEEYAEKTGGSKEFIDFQAHDFSFRGMSGPEDAAISGAAHLLFFKGTDTVPAIDLLEKYYAADATISLIGASVPASEHSVMSMGTQLNERDTYQRFIKELYPTGIVSIVSDTWDYWNVLTNIVPSLKDDIMSRDGKTVLRPDCYSEDTQILTNNGWRFFYELTEDSLVAQVVGDTYEFVKPSRIISQEYEGDMHHFHDYHGKVDLLVTPNHRIVLEQDGKERIIEASKLGPSGHHKQKMFRSAKSSLPPTNLSDLDRLRIAFQADGSFCSGVKSSIRFGFSKQRKIDRLIEILSRIGIDYIIYDLKDGRKEINVKVDSSLFSKDFEWVPNDIDSVWANQFLDELSYWDSSIRSEGRFKFDSMTLSVINKVEYIAIAAGRGILITKSVDNRKKRFSDIYTAHITVENKVGGQSWGNTLIPYSGKVYCVTVPSGKVIVKRNKCILVSGNSGDPVKIICGDTEAPEDSPERKGSLVLLWETFGGVVNDKGFKHLDPHIGLIYGDSITPQRAQAILEGMTELGFASDNIVFGVGSYTYNVVSRDTHGFAVKATYGEVEGQPRIIFKDPATDKDKVKKSLRGMIAVTRDENHGWTYSDGLTWDDSFNDDLLLYFSEGHLYYMPCVESIAEEINLQSNQKR